MKRAILPILALALSASLQAARATDDVPSTRPLYLQLIQQARIDGRPRAALAYLDDFERRYPHDLEARILRVNSLLDLGKVEEAGTLAQALPDDRNGTVSAVRGHVAAARNDWNAAISYYQVARAARPADPFIRNALGYALLRVGRYSESIDALKGAADLAPGDEIIRNNLILALLTAGQRAEANRTLQSIRNADARADLRKTLLAEVERIHLSLPRPQGKGS